MAAAPYVGIMILSKKVLHLKLCADIFRSHCMHQCNDF